ncbi:23S rRNA (uracil(1939)-C(5))-methyltransferase RlmD [Paraburkholderia sprentiae WSM5005]|uniref:23S rRNA (uracil(1939)-C(5))-methyltransferase RlmD n=1 Tax=Paraburkholderia sprentiae WSM5005 TaxID=754502 RepID=A0A1I9YF54_9BURK|nr:23S rRNA (uracil(1939)-C(5))-methyltransferase RlmD [Paraburkholderia sprentiae]APA84937.1 23S rRNA (uracil(1939)-C(5))-methyltransferase RlmD [Paraburkholderia sprentiae WSM5005]
MSRTAPQRRSPRRSSKHARAQAPAPAPVITGNEPVIEIVSLDMEARGVGRTTSEDGTSGKVVFVEGALPGELVSYATYRSKPKFEQAEVVQVLRESVIRTTPKCAYFDICGGCSMQHLDTRAQVAVKQRVLEDNLQHLAKLRPETVFRPIHGPSWGYRYRARLAVRFLPERGGMRIGFHEKKSSYIADMKTCEVLPPHVSALLMPLRFMVRKLSIYDRMPQLELAVGSSVTALVVRNLEPLTAGDEQVLREFADEHDVQFWIQPGGPDTATPFYPLDVQLEYTLPEYGIRMPFKPTDFTQVNHAINRVLVSRVLRLLAPSRTDRVLDLFCGIGNFTLPLGRISREVVGIEGSEALVQRALANAELNGVAGHTSFACRNLFEVTADDLRALGHFDKFLIDPPREGALAIAKALAEIAQSGNGPLPKRIVYVSCAPATLARDAGLLVHEAGYRLVGAGVVNMFPHTSHVESIALFERD